MIALILWASGGVIGLLLYIIMRQNWHINELEEKLQDKALDELVQLSEEMGLYDRQRHDFEESANFDPK